MRFSFAGLSIRRTGRLLGLIRPIGFVGAIETSLLLKLPEPPERAAAQWTRCLWSFVFWMFNRAAFQALSSGVTVSDDVASGPQHIEHTAAQNRHHDYSNENCNIYSLSRAGSPVRRDAEETFYEVHVTLHSCPV